MSTMLARSSLSVSLKRGYGYKKPVKAQEYSLTKNGDLTKYYKMLPLFHSFPSYLQYNI